MRPRDPCQGVDIAMARAGHISAKRVSGRVFGIRGGQDGDEVVVLDDDRVIEL